MKLLQSFRLIIIFCLLDFSDDKRCCTLLYFVVFVEKYSNETNDNPIFLRKRNFVFRFQLVNQLVSCICFFL
jgi:hypothetical protein